MGLRFTNLASGSGGNASLIEADGFGVLVDAGLGPRLLTARFAAVGLAWSRVHAVILTHTHSDHWNDRTLAHLLRRRVPFYCHAEHGRDLEIHSPSFGNLRASGLLRFFDAAATITFAPGLTCQPIPLSHDGGATFGFRFTGPGDLFGNAASLAYAADLGTWDGALVDACADVDLLALEFNHDATLERGSGRSPHLIARVLGDEGHLSNDQAAGFLREVVARATTRSLRHVVQLHLSRECNRPALARAAAHAVLSEIASDALLHTADQHTPTAPLDLGDVPPRPARSVSRKRRSGRFESGQRLLPGFGGEYGLVDG
jgi:glyoxylase-like metal-dependent hydrolase (beta-lactamase superfamily II)